jgi:hypothetical protein
MTPTIEGDQEVVVNWRFLGKDFETTGELHIQVRPRIIEYHSVERYSSFLPAEVRLENYDGPDPEEEDFE